MEISSEQQVPLQPELYRLYKASLCSVLAVCCKYNLEVRSMDDEMDRTLTRLAVSLFAGTVLAAIFCAGGTVRGLLRCWPGPWPDFVEISLQDPLML